MIIKWALNSTHVCVCVRMYGRACVCAIFALHFFSHNHFAVLDVYLTECRHFRSLNLA